MVAMRGIKPFSKRVLANIRLYRKFSPVSRSFGDVDNLVKSICDALNGIAYNDDSQIVDLIVGKYQDAANPRAEIFLEELDDILLE